MCVCVCVFKEYGWIWLAAHRFLRNIMRVLVVQRKTKGKQSASSIKAGVHWLRLVKSCVACISQRTPSSTFDLLLSRQHKKKTQSEETNKCLSFSSWPSSSAATTCLQHKHPAPCRHREICFITGTSFELCAGLLLLFFSLFLNA